MARKLTGLAVLLAGLASVGCSKNIVTGRCDCTNDPSSRVTDVTPGNPYTVLSDPATPAAPTTPAGVPAIPTAPMAMPK